MIKIQALTARELRKVLALLKDYCHEPSAYKALQSLQLLYVPIHGLSQLLPPQWQFVPALYVAASRDDVLGLIRLRQDGARKNRWRIEEIIIDPDASSYDVGTQLINYVVNRYGGAGVQTFVARVYSDQGFSEQDKALGLLKSCGFRHCTRLYTYQHSHPSSIFGNSENRTEQQTAINIKGMRLAFGGDGDKLVHLYQDMLSAESRSSLQKTRADFGLGTFSNLSERLKGIFRKHWVVEDAARDVLTASAEISTPDFQHFALSVIVHPGWSDRYEDLVRFGIQQILRNTANATVYLETYDFTKSELPVLESLGFERQSTAEILVKDYWITLSENREKLRSPILLFADKPSPAINSQQGQ